VTSAAAYDARKRIKQEGITLPLLRYTLSTKHHACAISGALLRSKISIGDDINDNIARRNGAIKTRYIVSETSEKSTAPKSESWHQHQQLSAAYQRETQRNIKQKIKLKAAAEENQPPQKNQLAPSKNGEASAGNNQSASAANQLSRKSINQIGPNGIYEAHLQRDLRHQRNKSSSTSSRHLRHQNNEEKPGPASGGSEIFWHQLKPSAEIKYSWPENEKSISVNRNNAASMAAKKNQL